MTEQIVIASLRAAIRTRKPVAGLIHHSDRGGQYAGKQYRKIIKRADMKQSMSRAGDCYDNAFMEPCFGTIKTELEMTEYKTMPPRLKIFEATSATTTSKESTLESATKRHFSSNRITA